MRAARYSPQVECSCAGDVGGKYLNCRAHGTILAARGIIVRGAQINLEIERHTSGTICAAGGMFVHVVLQMC